MTLLRTLVTLSPVSFVFSAAAIAETGVPLIQNGRCRHRIVLNPTASPSEKHAAEELQAHVKACTGAELPIVQGAAEKDAPMIVLGCGAAAQSLGVNPTPAQLGEQGFLLRTVPPHIVIAGSPQAGTLYGVHRFLEQCLGVRWYAPGVTKTPQAADIAVPATDRLVRPAFAYRNVSYTWPGGDADFLARMGDNVGGGTAESPRGTQYAFDGTCHSYFGYISPREFFKTHPEYFSEIGGVRFEAETQLCLTNPEVLNIVTERMLKRMKEMPTVRQHNFSQMDYYNYCECARCREVNDRYGTPGGTQYWFVNQLAERTSKAFPDKLVGTLAYIYTEQPPENLTMHPNVAVWLCHMFPSCDSHPIATCPLNADYKRRALAWSKLCSHLYIWHYIVDFAHYYNPFPNFRAMAADMKFYRDIGAEGVYLQGMGHGGGGGEFSLLRPYYGMKLLWDPDQNADGILRDFLDGYYGPAAGPIWEYVRLLHDTVEKETIHMHLYTNPAQGYLTDPIVRRSMALFDQAEEAVKDNPELLERVRVARMPLTYARAFPRNGYKIEEDKLVWQGDLASPLEILGFDRRMKAHGFRNIREWEGYFNSLLLVGGLLGTQPPVHTIANDHLRVEIVPLLGGRALRIVHRKTDQCVTAWNVTRSLFFPYCGGLEARTGETFRSFGWMEPAAVADKSLTAITLTSRTADGLLLKRTLTLDANAPKLHVEMTATNPGERPRETRLRSHLELNLGELAKTRVRFTSLAGQAVDRDMTGIIAGLREGEHFYERNAPRGSWTLSGTKGLQVTQTFDSEQTDFTWLYAYPDYLGELEVELWAKRKTLNPGESLSLRQDIEVSPVP